MSRPRTRALIALAALAGLAGLAGCTTSTYGHTGATDAEAFVHEYLDVLSGRDARAIRSVHVTDGRFAWFTDGKKRYAGVDEVLAAASSPGSWNRLLEREQRTAKWQVLTGHTSTPAGPPDK